MPIAMGGSLVGAILLTIVATRRHPGWLYEPIALMMCCDQLMSALIILSLRPPEIKGSMRANVTTRCNRRIDISMRTIRVTPRTDETTKEASTGNALRD
jgi:hypothetical protein